MADLTGKVSSTARTLSSGSRYIMLEFTQTRRTSTNQSKIDWSLRGAGTATGYVMSGPFNVSIDNKSVYSSSTRIKLYGTTVIASGTLTVNHNSDGSKLLPISISAAIYEYATNCSGSKTFTLVANPRESTISASDTDIGKKCVISINKAVTSYTSTLKYKLYKSNTSSTLLASDTIVTKTAQSSYDWEIPVSFYANLWDTDKGYCVIECTTYNGNNPVGSVKSTGIWITMDDSVNPTISECSVVNNDPSTNVITGETGFIKGQGYVSVNCSAVLRRSAQLASMTVTNGDITYNINNNVTAAIQKPTSSDFVFKVTDSRGKSAEQTVQLTGYDYTNLSISIKQATLEVDPEDVTKGRIIISVAGNGYNGNLGETPNTVNIEFKITDENGQQTTVVNTQSLDWSQYSDDAYHRFDVNDVVLSVNNPDSTYRVKAIVKDTVNPTGVYTTERSLSRVPVYDYGKSDFNFNVPIHYKDKPYIDTKYTVMGFSGNQGAWRARILEDKYIELWGNVWLSSVSINKQIIANGLYSTHQPLIIPLPNLGPKISLTSPFKHWTVNANMVAVASHDTELNKVDTYDNSIIVMTASPYIESSNNLSGAQVRLTALSTTAQTSKAFAVFLHISGVK